MQFRYRNLLILRFDENLPTVARKTNGNIAKLLLNAQGRAEKRVIEKQIVK